MKKLIILILIVAALGWWFSRRSAAPAPQADSTATTVGAGFQPDASNATFDFEGESVTLVDGKAVEKDESDDAILQTETELLDERAYGDLNDDGKPDAVVLLARSGGGSGTFVYAAAFVSGPVGYKGTNAVFLGDRIAPQSVSISGSTATVKFLDRKEDESFAVEPTVSVTKQFTYKNGGFQEK